ncbi:EscU/YscU/HrcU family type III secretion system export apparatus switch protein [Paludisphaera mucosa]|uniref:EscU/YscU/HrcU family type III secretion system export apparatus switch protein n=1 Tax=Paludisphaera mucosa TaxID=3030827 RepID=A0ABT6F503_9BACT|nr:EscU/YscU/HrcU family type III secretion system export apparatus switch protein [Paludisphaera mucosa]MDG3002518.1 EscU/YscU/HrcU family type III secretion system export apparatus switch protein [Paludisphaera mucosa]
MSEDRTQPASPRRRQLAREQGQAAHSPELTAAAGWLVAVTLLTCFGSSMSGSLVDLVRSPLVGPAARLEDAVDLAWLVRDAVVAVASPVAILLVGFAAGAFAAHQGQTRGLWSPALIAPDPSRLWRVGRGGGIGAGVERSVWSVVKALILASVVVWAVRSRWGALQGLSFLDFPDAARGALSILLAPAWALAAAMLAVGVVDYGLRSARFEAMLQTTPEEQREDLRTIEGDPKARASRRRLAQAWRDGTPELLEGASLVLLGDAGLVVVLAGGPPPRKVFVRVIGQGRSGGSIRKAAVRAKLPQRDAAQLALRIASRAEAASPRAAIADPLLIAQLRAAWPTA